MRKKKPKRFLRRAEQSAVQREPDKARVYVKSCAYNKMLSLVCGFETEIGWHGLARRVGTNAYEIYDVIVYPQVVTGCTTVAPDDGNYDFWLMSQPEEVFENLRFQGHSHVRMGCFPSGVDTAFYKELLKDLPEDSFYIFMILNKHGDSWMNVVDRKTQTVFENDNIQRRVVYDDPIIDEAKALVTKKKYDVWSANKKTEGSKDESC